MRSGSPKRLLRKPGFYPLSSRLGWRAGLSASSASPSAAGGAITAYAAPPVGPRLSAAGPGFSGQRDLAPGLAVAKRLDDLAITHTHEVHPAH